MLAVVLAVIVARWILKRGSGSDSLTPVRPMVPPAVSLTQGLQDQLRTTAIRGNPELAIKELQRQMGMSELDASAVVHAILAGRIFPTPSDTPLSGSTGWPAGSSTGPTPTGRSRRRNEAAPIDVELLAMLRELVEQDPTHRAAAVMLLRQHTGMHEREARRFVEAL